MSKTATNDRSAGSFLLTGKEDIRLWAPMLKVMKLLSFLLFIVCMTVAARPKAQTVSLSIKDAPMAEVFTAIKKQTGFEVAGNLMALKKARPVTVSVKDMPLETFLQLLFRDQPLTFRLDGQNIFLLEKPGGSPVNNKQGIEAEDLPPPTTDISGRILSAATGEAVASASILVKGQKSGTSSDRLGKFSLSGLTDNVVLEISSIGFKPVAIPLGKLLALENGKTLSIDKTIVRKTGSEFTFFLLAADVEMDETVVTAYGKTTRRLATGNIATIKGEEIQRQPVMGVLQALVGRVPGMVVSPSSGNAAAPVSVTIRGRNTINQYSVGDPLYVIDGVPFTFLNASKQTELLDVSTGIVQGGLTNTNGENPLFSINPADIERIEVFKDADATAIYGSRGANGVILITTKRAKAGPPRLDISVNYGLKFNQRYPKLLNTQEYLAIRKEALRNDGIIPDKFNAPDLVVWDSTKFTDWQRELIGTGNTLNVNVGIGGGNSQSSYSLSAAYVSQQEIMNNGGKNIRGNVNMNFNHSGLNQKFKLRLGNTISLTDSRAYALGNITALPPNAPDIYTEKGEFNFVPYRGQQTSIFPFSGLKVPSDSRTINLRSNMNVSYEILNGLIVSTLAGFNFSSNENIRITPGISQDTFYKTNPGAFYGRSANKGFSLEPQIAYATTIGKGRLQVQLIGTYNSLTTRGETIEGRNFANDALMKSYNNAGTRLISEGYKEYKYVSGAGILNYNWNNKYIVNLNLKRDGSSRFGPGKQFGNFYSVGASWIASEEGWLKDRLPSWLDFIKFRGSYGITGSDVGKDYEYLSRWGTASVLYSPLPLFKYNGMDAFHVLRPLAQDFHWESTRKSEISTSLAFFDYLFTLDISTYRNVSSDQLTEIPTPTYTGFDNTVTNWQAKVANTGLEINLEAKFIQKKDMSLSMRAGYSRNRNRLLDFPNLAQSHYKSSLKIGYPVNVEYLLKYTGIDPLTGSYTFEDLNKDGTINSGAGAIPSTYNDDRYIIMSRTRKYDLNGGLVFSYKGLMVTAGFEYVNTLQEDPYLSAVVGGMFNISLPSEISEKHWKNPGDQAKYPRYTTTPTGINKSPFNKSDGKYVNGSFFRMNSLAISYSLPQNWCKKVGMNNASFSIQTSNIFYITPYEGLDPEIKSGVYSTPIPRTIESSLRFSF
ncbi:SusC/RagA family TonB-linked outer membrane protein [Pseudobacter ginsenosidimutans]|nr:SusC/RagA family TonB-linked outer membrane protein [Pseudobacter ginsenosidimutans]QEC43140.1 SusC/RagA family TonB-linked outer membrane protein [Pseudobacter ginsenosidimutans]